MVYINSVFNYEDHLGNVRIPAIAESQLIYFNRGI